MGPSHITLRFLGSRIFTNTDPTVCTGTAQTTDPSLALGRSDLGVGCRRLARGSKARFPKVRSNTYLNPSWCLVGVEDNDWEPGVRVCGGLVVHWGRVLGDFVGCKHCADPPLESESLAVG